MERSRGVAGRSAHGPGGLCRDEREREGFRLRGVENRRFFILAEGVWGEIPFCAKARRWKRRRFRADSCLFAGGGMRAQGGARGREADTVPTKRTGRAGGGCGGPERPDHAARRVSGREGMERPRPTTPGNDRLHDDHDWMREVLRRGWRTACCRRHAGCVTAIGVRGEAALDAEDDRGIATAGP